MATKFNRKDPLCYKVYNWEDGQRVAGVEIFKTETIKRWVQKACKFYRVPVPQIKNAPDGAKTSGYGEGTIWFVPLHKNMVVVLHEVAHHICDQHFGADRIHHSDEWFGIYCWLLLKFDVYEPTFLRGSLLAYKLTLRPLGPEKIL